MEMAKPRVPMTYKLVSILACVSIVIAVLAVFAAVVCFVHGGHEGGEGRKFLTIAGLWGIAALVLTVLFDIGVRTMRTEQAVTHLLQQERREP